MIDHEFLSHRVQIHSKQHARAVLSDLPAIPSQHFVLATGCFQKQTKSDDAPD